MGGLHNRLDFPLERLFTRRIGIRVKQLKEGMYKRTRNVITGSEWIYMSNDQNEWKHEGGVLSTGLWWRIGLTLFAGFTWLGFLIVWLFFFANLYDLYQNVAVVLLSILIVGVIASITWLSYGMKFRKKRS
jgi:hypothetical protein